MEFFWCFYSNQCGDIFRNRADYQKEIDVDKHEFGNGSCLYEKNDIGNCVATNGVSWFNNYPMLCGTARVGL